MVKPNQRYPAGWPSSLRVSVTLTERELGRDTRAYDLPLRVRNDGAKSSPCPKRERNSFDRSGAPVRVETEADHVVAIQQQPRGKRAVGLERMRQAAAFVAVADGADVKRHGDVIAVGDRSFVCLRSWRSSERCHRYNCS
jgi:hypothetical protein